MQNKVPLHMAIEVLEHDDDDRLTHLLRIGVVGMDGPLTVEVESDFYEWPRVGSYQTYGGIDLPGRLMDALVFKCFELLAVELGETDIAERTIPDATRWIEVEFLTAEAEVLLAELRRHVTPGLPVVPGQCTAFLPARLPPLKGPDHVR